MRTKMTNQPILSWQHCVAFITLITPLWHFSEIVLILLSINIYISSLSLHYSLLNTTEYLDWVESDTLFISRSFRLRPKCLKSWRLLHWRTQDRHLVLSYQANPVNYLLEQKRIKDAELKRLEERFSFGFKPSNVKKLFNLYLCIPG